MRLWTFVPCILEYFRHGLQANRPVFGLSIDCSVSTTCSGSMPTKWPTNWVHRPHPCVLTSCMLLRLLKTVENCRKLLTPINPLHTQCKSGPGFHLF